AGHEGLSAAPSLSPANAAGLLRRAPGAVRGMRLLRDPVDPSRSHDDVHLARRILTERDHIVVDQGGLERRKRVDRLAGDHFQAAYPSGTVVTVEVIPRQVR